MRKILSLCAIAIFAIQSLCAQEIERRAQSVYFEALGPGVTYSFNYDTRFQKTQTGLGGRIGASYFGVGGSSHLFTIPVQLNYLLGKGGNYFEVGAGATYASVKVAENEDDFLFFDEDGVIGTLTFGYRRQPLDGGFSFRGGFSPVFGSGSFIPYWPYLGFGYSF